MLIAWPSAQIAVMGGDQAAETILSIEKAKLPEGLSEEESRAILDRIRQTYEATLSPYHAAAHLLRVACRVAPEQPMRVGVFQV